MAYTKQQEIDIAKTRIAQGKGSSLDIANVKSANSGSLTGTLSGTTSGTSRSLPQDQPQLANFQSVMRQLQNANIQTQPSAIDKLKEFQTTTGITPQSAGAITNTLEMGQTQRLQDIVEKAKTAIDLVSEQEKRKEQQRQDNLKWAETLFKSVDNPFAVFSSNDIENMKLGIITPEMTTKVKNAPVKADYSFVQGADTTDTGVLNKATGKFTSLADQGLNRPTRNNNPLNIKLGGATQQWLSQGATLDELPATDGGQFLKFATPEQGFQAAKDLLFNSGVYTNLSVDVALKKWSGKSYGAEIIPELKGKTIRQLDFNEQQKLIDTMAIREGYVQKEPSVPITTKTFDQYIQEEQQKAGMTFSPGKREKLRKDFEAQNVDSLTRVNQIEAAKDAARSLLSQLPKTRSASFKSSFDTLIKTGDLPKIKEFINTQIISVVPADQRNRIIGRSGGILALDKIEKDLEKFQQSGGNTNIFTGTREGLMNRIGTIANVEQARIANEIALAIVSYRQSMTGAQFSVQEAAQYEQIFPSVGNIPALNGAKIQSLRDNFSMNQRGALQTIIGENAYDILYGKKIIEIRVREKKTGTTGTLPENEFDPNIYERI